MPTKAELKAKKTKVKLKLRSGDKVMTPKSRRR
jgi:hypothetical protein